MLYSYFSIYTLYISFFIRIYAIESLKDLKYEDVEKELLNLQGSFAKMHKAKDLFSDYIKSSYDKNNFGETIECSPSIGVLTHLSSIENDIERPQVVISGEIHGDERIGVTSVLFASKLLIWSSQCVIKSVTEACNLLNERKISLEMRNWLAFLNSRRETYILPTANCMGYLLHKRQDGNIDVNRDFPYQRHDSNCMQSNTAKIFYYLMHNLASQVVVTFHGGMIALGYEWGALNHQKPNDKSPDHAAHSSIGKLMELFAGPTTTSTTSNSFYHAEPINSNIYSVAGGMEDWIYAAGWDQTGLKKCKNLKEIDVGEPRSLVFLVETANAKHPTDTSLGNEIDPFFQSQQSQQSSKSQPIITVNKKDEGRMMLVENKSRSSSNPARRPLPKSYNNRNIRRHNNQLHNNEDIPTIGSLGHVPRNARLVFAAIDMAQPYVCLKELKTKTQYLESLAWYVGGSIDIHSTFVSLYDQPNNGDELLRKASQGEWTPILQSLQQPGRVSPQWKSKRSLFRSLKRQRAYSNLFGKKKSQSNRKTTRNTNRITKDLEETVAEVSHEVWRLSSVQRGRGRWFPSQESTNSSDRMGYNTLHVKKGIQSSVSAFEQSSSSVQMFHYNTSSSPLVLSSSLSSMSTTTATTSATSSLAIPKEGDYWLVVWARVDTNWGHRGQGHPSNLGPQAHASRARTDPNYIYEQPSNKWRSKRIIKGRMYWPSDPIPVTLRADGRIIIRSHVLNCAWWNRN